MFDIFALFLMVEAVVHKDVHYFIAAGLFFLVGAMYYNRKK